MEDETPKQDTDEVKVEAPTISIIDNPALDETPIIRKKTNIDRLKELSALEKGWLNGDGERISDAALDTALALVTTLQKNKAIEPRIFPTPEGGLTFEWDKIELEINPDGKEIDLYGDPAQEDEVMTTESLQEALAWVADKLRE